ncbi:L,D-transpeptidase family protein [uncultured Thiodictyon sp.]|uniref:L,D-transpeptidase family protein n=1 Tax=uncultured Thiodictyon sp. TaxID=1846217 RepID=UPI0025DE215A|nr:L,D-transpeptidase family protein [uncultured Thiodictyon sp.]
MKSKAESSGAPGRRTLAGAVALGLGVVAVWVPGAQADTFKYAHPGDTVVGVPFYIKSRKHDTLLDIGRQNQVGYQDMEQANPKVNMWAPRPDSEVLVPTLYVLPNTPHTGIVLNRPEMHLYFYPPGKPDEVQNYPISVGREGWSTPLGTYTIASKVKDPTWTPPASIRAEHAAEGDILPAVVPAGPDNPLGPYAMRLSVPSYLIHGTDKPWGLGMPVSHGCIRMNNEGIIELFPQVPTGTTVTIVDQPYKVGWLGDDLYLEVHSDDKSRLRPARSVIPESVASTQGLEMDWPAVERAIKENTGLPQMVGSRRGLNDPLYLRNAF